MDNLLQYGIAGAAIGALVYVVRMFLTEVASNRKFVTNLADSCHENQTRASEAMTEVKVALEGLTVRIQAMNGLSK